MGGAASAGHLVHLVRSGRARTRRELQEVTGLSRSALLHRVDLLTGTGYLRASGVHPSTGGRPPAVLEFNTRHRLVLAADLGATHARTALVDLAGRVLAEEYAEIDITAGPAAVLDWLGDRFDRLAGAADGDVGGIGLGLPGPVDHRTGRLVEPPIMPGWHDFGVREHLRDRFGVPVLADNDANLMALGEHTAGHPGCPALVLVKVATGIGAGIIVDGAPFRGVDGGAGDIGHIRIPGHDDVPCMCGATGCLAAVASGRAIARQLDDAGFPTRTSREALARLRAGEPLAQHLTRVAGRLIGEVLATVVCLVNPGVLVLSGDFADTHFVTGVRETLYQRALARATRHLDVRTGRLGDRAGIVGAAAMVADALYSPDAIDDRLATHPG